jgi:3-hydroxymyristoyl/3-hydroxydecanoyl-(acyl carrier protein) dehydratase
VNYSHIIEKQPNRAPFLFLGKVIGLNQEDCTTSLQLTKDLWFFKCHWEKNPNMPAMLQLEAMSQTASLILFQEDSCPEYLYLAEIKKAYFLKKVLPGVEITISAKVEKKVNSIFVFKCKINGADGELLSKSTLSLVKPNG